VGFVSRSTPAVLVALGAQAAGLLVLLAVALAGADAPTGRGLGAGLAGGIVGGVGLVWLYRAFSGPSVGVAAPVAASGILLPVLIGVLRGETLDGDQLVGAAILVAGLVAVLHAGRGEPADAATVKLAAGAALCFGVFYVGLDLGASDGAAWVTVFARIGGTAVLVAMAARGGVLARARPGGWLALAGLAGVVDALGNLSFARASALGELGVVSLLSAAYPAVTVVLTVLVLRERITLRRAAGVLATVIGLGLIGL